MGLNCVCAYPVIRILVLSFEVKNSFRIFGNVGFDFFLLQFRQLITLGFDLELKLFAFISDTSVLKIYFYMYT